MHNATLDDFIPEDKNAIVYNNTVDPILKKGKVNWIIIFSNSKCLTTKIS